MTGTIHVAGRDVMAMDEAALEDYRGIGVAVEISDRIAVMYAGRIVETVSLRDVVKNLSHPYTRGLLHATIHGARRGERLDAIPGAPPRRDRLPPGLRFCTALRPRRRRLRHWRDCVRFS